ncbi:hypothetical protein BB560_001494 [Smittium megazygosporum]|uniref:Xylulose kinase n=1 Tax=Smittium megazygosporum TaxID=133381 RepID=A0A2T9ZHL9_9FUNG|nr:hypothetical protein BB560_001494 [Smittium megazygosporum]
MDNYFLGLDLSTQQIKALVFDKHGRFVTQQAVCFDSELPQYGTDSGRIIKESNKVVSPVLLWVDALDLIFSKLRENLGGHMSNIVAIGGSAQQHGSVYWRGFEEIELSQKEPLSQQLAREQIFTILDSPTWEDSSTTEYCKQLHSKHSPELVAYITGSVAYERFTGNQIEKIKNENPNEYSQTERISLISSFLGSLLIGKYAPIEVSDGSGMNLLDVQTRKWSTVLCDSELLSKLGPDPIFAGEKIGNIHPYYVTKYGINKDCIISSITGDNPGGLLFVESLPSSHKEKEKEKTTLLISLGTSDTVIFSNDDYPYSGLNKDKMAHDRGFEYGHVLSHPCNSDKWATLLCYKNGSLARKWVCDRMLLNTSGNKILSETEKWNKFEEKIACNSQVSSEYGFYYILPEIIPKASGVFRFAEKKSNEIGDSIDIDGTSFCETSSGYRISGVDAKLIVESQIMSMLIDIKRKGIDIKNDIKNIIVTGGASSNKSLLQTIADVFNNDVYEIEVVKSEQEKYCISSLSMPALGGAVCAFKCYNDEGNSILSQFKVVNINSASQDMVEYYRCKIKKFEILRDLIERKFN